MDHLHIDFETYSSVDIKTSGAYKYTESLDFEILIMAFSFNNNQEHVIDLAQGEQIPQSVIQAFMDPTVLIFAHNAAFERLCLRAYGFDIHPDRFRCSAVKSAYCGLPLSLGDVSKALQLGEAAKDARGAALIRYFSIPVKPTKANGMRQRNLPHHDLDKWEEFKEYCRRDVIAEKAILKRLDKYEIPDYEQQLYSLDQLINDRGISIDEHFARNAVSINNRVSIEILEDLRLLTGLDNPNSPAQLKDWLSLEMKKEITSLAKGDIPDLIKQAGAGSIAEQVLNLRLKGAKTSVKKYTAMINCLCADGKAHGLFQFYGAGRTGRWAGRLIQLQNLPRNFMKALEEARDLVYCNYYDELKEMPTGKGGFYGVPDILSQLVRTAFIPSKGNVFGVADFSAIEARVIAWLAEEEWRLEVFKTHGKIYEASASMMFNVDIDTISYKDADGNKVEGENYYMRALGKVAELALGYQGALGALVQMGGEEMGLSTVQMSDIVTKWRQANQNIVELWKDIEKNAILAVRFPHKEKISKFRGISFLYDGNVLQIGLPSGRKLIYQSPQLRPNQWGKDSLTYMGMDQVKKIWKRLDSYGGKLVENIVQAIARDILADSMIRLNAAGFKITMHVHDEAVADLPIDGADEKLEEMCAIMGEPIEWAEGLPLAADGYLTEFYKKD